VRLAAIACVLAGCGRLGFDERVGGPLGDGGPGDGGDGDSMGSGSANGLLVQQSPVVSAGSSPTVTLPMPTRGSTLLVATFAANDATNLTLPPGWQKNAAGTASGACTSVVATSPSAPAGQTMFMFGLPGPSVVQVTEWAGVGGLDSGGFGGGGPGTAMTITTLAADSTAGNLAIATFCQDVTTPTFTPGPGWTNLGDFANTAALPSITSEFMPGQPAAKITATATTSVSGKFAATVVTFHVP